jgi:hypothetical protein
MFSAIFYGMISVIGEKMVKGRLVNCFSGIKRLESSVLFSNFRGRDFD